MKDLLKTIHGRFVNETDFEESALDVKANGETQYKAFINKYIEYRYEPAIEEYDEARYFTPEFDRNLMRKIHRHPRQKITNI